MAEAIVNLYTHDAICTDSTCPRLLTVDFIVNWVIYDNPYHFLSPFFCSTLSFLPLNNHGEKNKLYICKVLKFEHIHREA